MFKMALKLLPATMYHHRHSIHYIDTVQSETSCRIGIGCLCLQDLDNLLDLSEEVTTRGSRDEERARELSKNR